jgi:tetratricopeptide (TPR) repeat protein
MDDAEKAFRRAVKLCRDLADRFPHVPIHHEQLLDAKNELMKFLETTGRVSQEQAEESRRQAIDTVETLVDKFSADPFFRWHLAQCYRDLAFFLKARGRTDEAIAAHRRELQQLGIVPPGHRSRPRQQSVTAYAQMNLGGLLMDAGQLEEGTALIRQASESFSKLAAEFPEHGSYENEIEECRRWMETAQAR